MGVLSDPVGLVVAEVDEAVESVPDDGAAEADAGAEDEEGASEVAGAADVASLELAVDAAAELVGWVSDEEEETGAAELDEGTKDEVGAAGLACAENGAGSAPQNSYDKGDVTLDGGDVSLESAQ